MHDKQQGRYQTLRSFARVVVGLYLFLAGFLVLCLSHHDTPHGHYRPGDHRAQMIEICTWAQETSSSHGIPHVSTLESLVESRFEVFIPDLARYQTAPQLLSIRAPPPIPQ